MTRRNYGARLREVADAAHDDLSELLRLQEMHRQCCDRQNERWGGDWNPDQPDWPYRDYLDYRNRMIDTALLYHRSDTVRGVIDKLKTLVVGDGVSYKLREKDDPKTMQLPGVADYQAEEFSESQLQTMNAVIEQTMIRNKWRQFDCDTVINRYRFGEALRISEMSPGADFISVKMEKSVRLQPPPGTVNDPIAEFGIELDSDDQPLNYYFYDTTYRTASDATLNDPDIKAAENVQHIKYGCSDIPRTFSPFELIYSNAEGVRSTRENARYLYRSRTRNAVVWELKEGTGLTQATKLLAAEKQKAKEKFHRQRLDRRDRGVHGDNPGEDVVVTGHKVSHPGVNLEMSDAVELEAMDQRAIGAIVDMADFLVTGSSDNGNRATFDKASEPLFHRIRTERRDLMEHDTELLWRALQLWFNWPDEMLMRAQLVLEFVAEFPPLEKEDENEIITGQLQLHEARAQSLRGIHRRLKLDSERISEELAEEDDQAIDRREEFGLENEGDDDDDDDQPEPTSDDDEGLQELYQRWDVGGRIKEHQGPGPHPSGTPQSVHGGGGGNGKKKVRQNPAKLNV